MATVLEHAPAAPGTPEPARSVCFVAWGAVAGRSEEIAAAVGGEARCFFPPGARWRPPVLVRWVLSAVATVAYLLRRRPKVIVVTNPPIFAALVAYGCARLIGASVILDSHPGAFGVQGDRVAAKLQRLHRWMVPRAALVLCTDETWCEQVRSWGGTAAVLHEAPSRWDCPDPARHDPLRVLVVGRFTADEPVAEVVEAARMVPDCRFSLTGEPARCPPEVQAALPANAGLVGFMGPEAYRQAVADADVILTLTTEPTSVMRAAYEAVYARRPLIVSDWPIDRELFPQALHAANERAALAIAVRSMCAHYDAYAASVDHALAVQSTRWADQRRTLIEAIEQLSG
jgi:hypothetical protein